MKKWCKFYPKAEEDMCVCDAGSDVSGSSEEDNYCSEEYAKTCQYATDLDAEIAKGEMR